ncbi:MAG: glycosyltransferase family 2 protein [Chloroflexi bacterium]|nr:glycosyltransferase family 2 protein [Chloroflexota bacterium]
MSLWSNQAFRSLCLALFWFSVLGIAYTYIGYPLLICLLARLRPRPVRQADIAPTVTVLVAAYNEQGCIGAKIENTLALDYPRDALELLVVTDGSSDRTSDLVASHAARDGRVHLAHEPERRGKAAALARAFPLTNGEIIVFSDANTLFPPHTLRALVRNFADPDVGGASGAKRMLRAGASAAGQGEGLYWRYESFLKRCDSAVSSVMGVPGEIWAARRTAYVPPEPDTLLDDFVGSLRMVAAGWRIVYEPEAIAYEEASPSLGAEWRRRARNAAGGWQAFFRLPGMMRHPRRLVTWQYLSHRMLRWMVTPALFPLTLLASLCLSGQPLYALALALQILFYLLALAGWAVASRGGQTSWLVGPFYVCLLNAAALAGGWRFLMGRQSVVWEKVR